MKNDNFIFSAALFVIFMGLVITGTMIINYGVQSLPPDIQESVKTVIQGFGLIFGAVLSLIGWKKK